MRVAPAVLLLALLPYGGCAGQPSDTTTSVTSARGALHTAVPSGWFVASTFRVAAPAGEGMVLADSKGRLRLKVYASATALTDRLGDDPTRRSVYSFRHIQAAMHTMDRFTLGEHCTRDSTRPLEAGGYYGDMVTFRCTGALDVEVRSIAMDARRTVVVYATVRDSEATHARQVARTAIAHLVVHRDALPRRGRPGGVLVTD